MVVITFSITAALYTASCGLFLGFLARGHEGVGRWGTRALGVAVGSHLSFLAADYVVLGNLPFDDIYRTLSAASLVIVVAYLLALLRNRITVLGGFITPVTLLFFIGAGVGTSVGNVSHEVRDALLPVHIGVNVLGIAAFTLAFAAALAYLIQERLLRAKKIGGLFQRLPALDVLDSLGFRLVFVGFPLLTVGIVTGTFWAVRLNPVSPAIDASQGLALVSWVVFASVLLLRVAAGWQGRRAAIGTLVGFLCAAAVLVGYMLREGGA